MRTLKKTTIISIISICLILLSAFVIMSFSNCRQDDPEDGIVIIPLGSDTPLERESPLSDSPEQNRQKGKSRTPHIISSPRTDNFTKSEQKEIEREGYLAFYYRRKYSPEEIRMAWNAVNTLFPDYTADENIRQPGIFSHTTGWLTEQPHFTICPVILKLPEDLNI
jgi:hypothetical protein